MQAIIRTKAGKNFIPRNLNTLTLSDIAQKGLNKADIGKVIVF